MSSTCTKTTKRRRIPVVGSVAAAPVRRTSSGNVKRTKAVETVYENVRCIDLTYDDESVVDLTSTSDLSPISFNRQSTSRASHRRRSREVPTVSSSSSRSSISLLEEFDLLSTNRTDSPDLPEVDFGQTNGMEFESESANNRVITCPICFDSDQEISKSGRQLMSTTCGHVFCNNCILESIHKNRCCPTCRKRLTARQFHPIFL